MTPKAIFGKPSAKKVVETPVMETIVPNVLFGGNVIKKSEKVASTEPSPIFGKNSFVRTRVNVTLDDLHLKYPNKSHDILKKVYQIVVTTNCEQINQPEMLNWGYDAQKKYNEIVEAIANICNNENLQRTKQLINEIGELIEVDTKTVGLIKKIFGKNKAEAIRKNISDKYNELNTKIPNIQNIISNIDEHVKDLTTIEETIFLHLAAGQHIVQHVPSQYKEVLENRLISLESLNLQFKVNQKQLELLKETSIKIIGIIQDTLSVEIPMWYNNNTLSQIKEDKKLEILTKIKI